MRYAQGGGLTAERRRFRERIRYEAGERFGRGERTAVIAKGLRVSERSVERWRRAWREGGTAALASAGPPKLPKLPDGQFAELEKELALGPAVHGWEDQRWTLAQIRALIAWKFSLDCSSAAVWRLLHRHGWSWQCPARRALERDKAGRRRNDCGGAGGVHRLRGRGRILDDAATRPYLGPAWTHAGGAGARPLLAPLVDRRDVLLQAGRDLPAHLPAAPSPQAQGQRTRHLRLERLPRPGRPRPHPAPGSHRADLGQVRRVALRCIPDSLGRNLEEHSWATGLTWRRKPKGTTACPGSGDRPEASEAVCREARAIWPKLDCLKPNLLWCKDPPVGMTPDTDATPCPTLIVPAEQPPR